MGWKRKQDAASYVEYISRAVVCKNFYYDLPQRSLVFYAVRAYVVHK